MATQKVTCPVVLVVEDDPMVRSTAVAMLEDLEFSVLEASNAQEAVGDYGELIVAKRRKAFNVLRPSPSRKIS